MITISNSNLEPLTQKFWVMLLNSFPNSFPKFIPDKLHLDIEEAKIMNCNFRLFYLRGSKLEALSVCKFSNWKRHFESRSLAMSDFWMSHFSKRSQKWLLRHQPKKGFLEPLKRSWSKWDIGLSNSENVRWGLSKSPKSPAKLSRLKLSNSKFSESNLPTQSDRRNFRIWGSINFGWTQFVFAQTMRNTGGGHPVAPVIAITIWQCKDLVYLSKGTLRAENFN